MPKEPVKTLESYAEDAIRAADGDVDAAKDILAQKGRERSNKRLFDYIYHLGCGQMIRTCKSNWRRREFEDYIHEDGAAADTARQVASIGRRTPALSVLERRSILTTYYLHGTVPLGMATREDIQRSIKARQGQVDGHQTRIIFERAVLRRLRNNDDTVSKVWTEAELEKLQRKSGMPVEDHSGEPLREAAE